MEQNQTNLTQAYWTLGDWFSRLGGSARYPGFRESDVALFIAVAVAEQNGLPIAVDMHAIDQRFLDAAARVLPRVRKRLGSIRPHEKELLALLQSFIDHVDAKLEQMPREKSPQWTQMAREITELTAQQSVGDSGKAADGLTGAPQR